MEILYQFFEGLNYVAIIIASLGLLPQLIFVLFGSIKPRVFGNAKRYRKIVVIIPAHNEEDVIGGTVKDILENQDYPKDKFDVFVCADNCTDSTFERAEQAGAHVISRSTDDPKKKMASYPTKLLMDTVIKEHPGEYELFIRFDADNRPDREYLRKMNDAAEEGVEVARGYEAAINPKQNRWAQVSSAYYIRDSRLACNFRERVGGNSMLTGAGMMVSVACVERIGGWDAMGGSEDAEFTINRILDGTGVHYVPEAVVYEDQPSTWKDNYHRITRMGHSLHALFWKKGWKLLFHGLSHFSLSELDMFYQLFFIPIGVLACLWFPAYYIVYTLLHLVNGFSAPILQGMHNLEGTLFTPEASRSAILSDLLPMIGYVLGSMYAIYSFQSYLSIRLSRKELREESEKGWGAGIFLSAPYMILYDIAITIGVLTNPGWQKINRNSQNENGVNHEEEEQAGRAE